MLWAHGLSGTSLPGDGFFPPLSSQYTSATKAEHYQAAKFYPVITLSLITITQQHVHDHPRLEHTFGTLATFKTPQEAFKKKSQQGRRPSGPSGAVSRTMLNCVPFILQVSDKWPRVKSVKNYVCLVVVSTAYCELFCVAKLMQKLSDDAEEKN